VPALVLKEYAVQIADFTSKRGRKEQDKHQARLRDEAAKRSFLASIGA
jgi:hypothetical protein